MNENSEKKLRSLIRQILQRIKDEVNEELEEATTTANIDGYLTPHAFKKSDGTDTDDEPDDDYVKRINTGTGYTKVNEGNRWQELRKDERTPNQKIGMGIREIRKQLSEIELFLKWYSKIKEESGLDQEQYWKRTNKHLNAIRERIQRISDRITKEL